ncbi:MAG: SAM-dependent chlorinase/fluorinase [Saprospiraceae bacterium]|nr:SAM-dependent chlorinase/fluorinase [Saprospiraceae bacterium]
MQNKLISLCTDFGNRDYRLAMLKTEILKSNNSIHLIDITHELDPFDLVEAAFQIRNVLTNFPADQIHVVWVQNASEDKGIILAVFKDQYLILPNNGLLSIITNSEQPEQLYRISDDSLEYKERIAKTIQQIIQGEDLSQTFSELEDPVRKISVQPIYQKERIQARVLYIDRYGNLVFNIMLEPFKNTCQERRFSFSTQNQQVISNFYLDEINLENGSFFVYFTKAGNMVLGLCGDHAARVMDVRKDDSLFIVFE